MNDADQEIIRRVLSNVLNRLEGENAIEAAKPSTSESSPVIFIVLNNSSADRANDERNMIAVRSQASEQPAAHPGLERFALAEENPGDPAPKKCFMEPDRICVNSGACETRGF